MVARHVFVYIKVVVEHLGVRIIYNCRSLTIMLYVLIISDRYRFRIPSKHGPRPYVRVIKCLNLKAGNLGENQKKTWEKTEFILYLKNKSLE